MSAPTKQKGELRPYLSPAGAWALALGTSIGWGSFVVTGNTYLSQAGPGGSVLGLLLGAVVMLVVGRSYHCLMNRCPEAGGVFAYARETLGYDHGFLTCWFLVFTYFTLLWANATSIPLFARYFLGDFFQVGPHYVLFGYQVYLTEVLLSLAAIFGAAVLCARNQRLTARVQLGLTLVFVAAIAGCFAAVVAKNGGEMANIQPIFPSGQNKISQVVRIACISPWAFIGFENISHSAEEFRFSKKLSFPILAAAVLTATALYCFVILLSVSAHPPEYSSWLSYIGDLSRFRGIQALPAFYAVSQILGRAGLCALHLALFGLIATSLLGNTVALSRLLYALAREEVLPRSLGRVNGAGTPERAVWTVALCSAVVPFLGRSAISWLVDVATIGSTLTYGLVCSSAYCTGRRENRLDDQLFGIIGVAMMAFFGAILIYQNFFGYSGLAKESYFLFTLWAILGFLFFSRLLVRDQRNRFGSSIVVWIALLSLILFTSIVWVEQDTRTSANTIMGNIRAYYSGQADAAAYVLSESEFISREMDLLHSTHMQGTLLVLGLFIVSLLIMLSNYSIINKRSRERDSALMNAQAVANTDPLTGVKSRHAYLKREELMNQRIWAGEMEPFAVVLCDVNNLKEINDTLGHKAGDEYIRGSCRIVCQCFQHSPVFRVGGDEFVAVLTGGDYENRCGLFASLTGRFEENSRIGEPVMATGMAEYDPGEDRRVSAVFERADREMYRRKRRLKELRGASESL